MMMDANPMDKRAITPALGNVLEVAKNKINNTHDRKRKYRRKTRKQKACGIRAHVFRRSFFTVVSWVGLGLRR